MARVRLEQIQACVFDAYGTLFDVHAAAKEARELLGERWQALSESWRTKQLQYTWLRSLMGQYADFWQVTGDALDYAMAASELVDPALRERLMKLYLRLTAYPEVAGTLSKLKERGLQLAILSNGAPHMLAAAVDNAGIARQLDAVLSVDELRVYKPDPKVYQLAVDRLGLPPEHICFVSANSWDAYAARAFGLRVVWCNRLGQPPEWLPMRPDAEIDSLKSLPDCV